MRLLLDTTASAKRHRMALLPSLRELQYIGVSLDSIYRYYRYNRSRSSPLIACSDIAASDDHSASLPRSEVVEGEYFSASASMSVLGVLCEIVASVQHPKPPEPKSRSHSRLLNRRGEKRSLSSSPMPARTQKTLLPVLATGQMF